MLALEEIFDFCWCFIRGDLSVRAFEQWVYETSELESAFSDEFYLTLISVDYSLAEAVHVLRTQLQFEIADFAKRECECHTLSHTARIDMGYHEGVFKSLKEVASYGEPLWWLWLAKCSVCGQDWMIGNEERANDVFLMKRMTGSEATQVMSHNQWPDDFKEYDQLIQIDREILDSIGR